VNREGDAISRVVNLVETVASLRSTLRLAWFKSAQVPFPLLTSFAVSASRHEPPLTTFAETQENAASRTYTKSSNAYPF
jgi:hypothetical protein